MHTTQTAPTPACYPHGCATPPRDLMRAASHVAAQLSAAPGMVAAIVAYQVAPYRATATLQIGHVAGGRGRVSVQWSGRCSDACIGDQPGAPVPRSVLAMARAALGQWAAAEGARVVAGEGADDAAA